MADTPSNILRYLPTSPYWCHIGVTGTDVAWAPQGWRQQRQTAWHSMAQHGNTILFKAKVLLGS